MFTSLLTIASCVKLISYIMLCSVLIGVQHVNHISSISSDTGKWKEFHLDEITNFDDKIQDHVQLAQ